MHSPLTACLALGCGSALSLITIDARAADSPTSAPTTGRSTRAEGYTYFDPRTGHEFSAVAGVTYNFENPDTDYRNGVDAHIDWAISQFFSESLHAGIVGYFYQQLTGDSGTGAVLGDFKSSTYAIGPPGRRVLSGR